MKETDMEEDENKEDEDGEKEQGIRNINLIEEISSRIAEWRQFGQVLKLDETFLDIVGKLNNADLSTDHVELTAERNRFIVKEACEKRRSNKENSKYWKFWKNVLEQFDNGKKVVIEIERYFPEVIQEECELLVVDEILCRVGEWRQFGRLLDLDESFLDTVGKLTNHNTTVDHDRLTVERNRLIITKIQENFKKRAIKRDTNSWKFWRNVLEKFDNGKMVIIELERCFPKLIHEVSSYLVHEFASTTMIYLGHPIQRENTSQIDKSNFELAVCIGSGACQIMHYQDINEWSQTQQRYMDIYSLFKDEIMINFHDLNESCPILKTLGQYLKNAGDHGFVTKGYHIFDHYKWFAQCSFVNAYKYENFLCLIAKKSVLLSFTKCYNDSSSAWQYSSGNILTLNALHNELQSNQIAQVNVLVYNDDTKMGFCNVCENKSLYIHEEVLMNEKMFEVWISEVYVMLDELQSKMNLQTTPLNDDVVEKIKKDMITYEALQNTDALPSFTKLGECQMEEMKKCVLLPTLLQFTILHINEKHVFITGCYGSGKTIVLRKKLEKCLAHVDAKEIFYYICCDQQSQYSHFMESVKLEYPDNRIIVCNSKDFRQTNEKPNLSVILNRIRFFWKAKTVHVFIDEFPGSLINEKEVSKLQKILPAFADCFITIALQAMEESIYGANTEEIVDGYQYDLLLSNTSFGFYNLDYSLRCSLEINEFVKMTSKHLESQKILVNKVESSSYERRKNIYMDRESTRELNFQKTNGLFIETKVSYNFSSQWGHVSSNGPVNIFIYDTFDKANPNTSQSIFEVDSFIPQIYISILDYILTHIADDKKAIEKKSVICTYDAELYDAVYYCLKNGYLLGAVWTTSIQSFIEPNSQYNTLLTDHASLRGFEFKNVIFLLRLGSTYLKYRMIECFTRATTRLYVIADNVNTCDDGSIDDQLLHTWRTTSSEHVKCFDCVFDQITDAIIIMKDDKVLLRKPLYNCSAGSSIKFPWKEHENFQEREEISEIENDGFQTIQYLCANDNVDILCEYFETNEIDILSYCAGSSNDNLLRICSFMGGFNIIQFLVSKYGFDLESRNTVMRTALHYSAMTGHINIVRFLLEQGANINATDEQFGKTPLHYAAENGYLKITKLLVDNKANVNATADFGKTPLSEAVKNGHVKIVQVLIANKANVNVVDQFGFTPIFDAAKCGCMDIKILIDNNSNVHEQIYGESLLHIAAKNGNIDAVKLLLDEKLNIDATIEKDHGDDGGKTSLHVAAQNRHFQVVKLLIENNANINVTTKRTERTPLHYALTPKSRKTVSIIDKRNMYNITKLLIDANANINARDIQGKTPLHVAAENGFVDIAKLLLDNNANIHATDTIPTTPRFFNGMVHVVTDDTCKTPLDYARLYKHHDFAEAVEEYCSHRTK